jgi:hypothetical protein
MEFDVALPAERVTRILDPAIEQCLLTLNSKLTLGRRNDTFNSVIATHY